MEKNTIFRFWAKTSSDEAKPNAFHPLICHLIDVASAAHALWEKVLPEITKKRLAKAFNLENDLPEAGRLIALLIGLHDLGKCSPSFALRGEYDKLIYKNKQTVRLLELYRETDYFCGGFKKASEAPHNFVTSVILPPILQAKFGFSKPLANSVSEIIGGHHGTFPDNGFLTRKTGPAYCGDAHWRGAQREIVDLMAELFEVGADFKDLPDEELDHPTAMIFAGLTTVADWMGSNADFFSCEVDDSTVPFEADAQDYLQKSRIKTEEALQTLGWTGWPATTGEKTFKELFPFIDDRRHLQNVAIKMVKDGELDAAGIAVVESPMGEGKTEAGMYLADTWNARLGTRGIYFALPTQATSNQMFSRIAGFLESRFKGQNLNVQLMLQHGHSSISAEFEEKLANFRNFQKTFDDCETAEKSELSNVAAAEWFTYQKKGLLVPFGVGTIDQILLSVLQTKHVFVRLFGLAGKTVIIDEVHAYDAYMSTLLERLLEWLASLGSPVVLLSATLPKKKRDALIGAYLQGLGKLGKDELPQSADADIYPRISYANAAMPNGTFKIRGLETSPQNTKTLRLAWKNEETFVDELKAKLKDGGCAAIICNTVDRAQKLHERLQDDSFFQGTADDGHPKLDLLHARYRFRNRDEREKQTLVRFGKEGTTVSVTKNGQPSNEPVKRPECAVLISTQIIEQSLDLDFDLMISELAPADLLLQRAGRLQRHERERLPEFAGGPVLWIIEPETDAAGKILIDEKSNLPKFGPSGFIYDRHILLRSWLALRGAEKIEIPGDIEKIIEKIYDEEKVFENLDETEQSIWKKTLEVYLDNCRLEKNEAETRYVFAPHYEDHLGNFVRMPKEEDASELHPVHQAQTRLIEPTATIVCLWEKDGRLYSDETYIEEISLDEQPAGELPKKLLFNSLSVSSKSVVFDLLKEKAPPGWEKSPLLRRHRVLVFDAKRKCEKFGYVFELHKDLGLRITRLS